MQTTHLAIQQGLDDETLLLNANELKLANLPAKPEHAYSDEIDHVFRPCCPPVGAKRR